MKKVLFLLFLFFFVGASFGQYALRIVVNEAASRDLEDWYVAGTFNNWNPKDEAYKLKPFGNKRKAIVLDNIPAGKYEFKFTRGSWEKEETAANGSEVLNHEVELKGDTIVYFRIAGWKDDYPDRIKPNTAMPRVKVIDTAFFIPQLNRSRRIWAYLPRSYATSTKTYPVLYMQDGQNLFSEHTAAFGEWGVDEALDSLELITKKECIVIGIDHGGDKRMSEYNPYLKTSAGQPSTGVKEADKYVEFVAKTLKPFIDKTYRTQKDSTHTFIAGSSLGGLISLYAVIKYPDVFGGAGVFSPSLQLAQGIYQDLSRVSWKGNRKFFLYAGGKESATLVADLEKVADIISRKGNFETRIIISPLGTHDEKTWRQEFPDFYKWITR